jgi:hypothetical protein
LAESIAWFEKLFGRAPDARPMTGLVEWHHGESSGFQLFKNPADAGHGTLTLIVDGLKDEKVRLETAKLTVGEIESADYVSLIRLRDPDDNLVVMAQPD